MLDLDITFGRGSFSLRLQAKLTERVIGLFGRSGSGKTTAVHLVAGLLAPQQGRIALDGRTLFSAADRINVPAHRRRIGVVFQDTRLFPHLSVRNNLGYGQRLAPAGDRRFGLDPIVELLELGSLLDRRPQHLSGGERQRVALGRALLSSPKLLLMDEPLAALDQRLKKQIIPFLQRVRDGVGIPIIYISHEISEVLQLADHLLVLDEGQTIGCGRYGDLAQEHQVLDHVLPTGLLNVLEMIVADHEQQSGCTRLVLADRVGDSDTGAPRFELRSALSDVAVGERVSVAIRPQDIALALAAVEATSVRNQFSGTIRRFVHHGGQAIVELDVGTPLLVEISSGSFSRLGLAVGKRVWCLLKANAVQLLGVCSRS